MQPNSSESAGDRYLAVLENLTANTLDRLDLVTASDVHFRDPFNDVRGRAAVRRVFERMFDDVADLRFRVVHAACSSDQGLALWHFSGRLRHVRNAPIEIDGVAHLCFNSDGAVTSHTDYWDPSGPVYAKVPILGSLVRLAKRRLAVTAER
ncbi:MAG: nuclear transport factor 2 family protein [Rhodospirillales bacterium]|nr:MAG: nuclear transport factor 2 family protein [Rhodospirillales bacterium]